MRKELFNLKIMSLRFEITVQSLDSWVIFVLLSLVVGGVVRNYVYGHQLSQKQSITTIASIPPSNPLRKHWSIQAMTTGIWEFIRVDLSFHSLSASISRRFHELGGGGTDGALPFSQSFRRVAISPCAE
jgi:hypothetical protein